MEEMEENPEFGLVHYRCLSCYHHDLQGGDKQAADLTAMLIAIQNTPDFAPLHIKTTSTLLVKTFTNGIQNLERAGWFATKNATL